MNREHRFRKNNRLNKEQKKLLQVLFIPLIVIILIIVIVIADRIYKKKEESPVIASVGVMTPADTTIPETVTQATEAAFVETEPTEPTDQTDPFETDALKRNTDPGIEALMQNYFTARKTADPQLMNQLYGMGELNEWQLETERVRLWTNAKYMTDFTNINLYVMDGLTPDCWLVYATTNIKFRMVETLAPMIMYSYVTKDTDGNYFLVDNKDISFEVEQFIEKANQSEDVCRLAAVVNSSLQEALNTDEELKSVYGILHSNSPVWGDEYQESMAEVKILTGEELEAREANETAGEAEENAAEPDTFAPVESTDAEPEVSAPIES